MSSRPLRVAMLVVDDRSNPLVGTPRLGSAPTALLEGFAELGPKEIEVHVVSCLKQPSVAPTKLAPNIWYHPLFVPSWAFLRTLHLGPAFAVRRFLREKIKPDVVHSHGIEWWCGVAGALSGYPSLLTIHGNIRAILANSVLKPRAFWQLQATLGDFAIRQHGGVICISEHVRKSVATAARKTWLIPNALRKEFLHTQTATIERSGRPLLLVVGTITENKRPLEMLEILFALHGEGTEFEVAFIGHLGTCGVYARRFAARLEEATRLGFALHKEHLDAAALAKTMAQADALLHFPMDEAFGLVVAEAISQGLTVFASNVGGIREVGLGYRKCHLVGRQDFDGLLCQLRSYIKNISKHTCKYGSDALTSRFSPQLIGQKTIQAYSEVLA
jgi:glycosyltransferase involved in cell wall biosynthesis